MSKNLVIKNRFAMVATEDKRIIDTNALMKKRMEELAEKLGSAGNDGFTAGLNAEEVQELLTGDGEEAVTSGNVIKAGEEAERLLEQARREAEELQRQAAEEAQLVRKRAAEEAAAEKQRILEEARAQGYREGELKARQELERARNELTGKEKQLETAYEEQLRTMEPQLTDAITDIYEHIFRVELGSYREIVSHLISTTLRKLEGGNEFIIHVSKEDYPYVNMQKKQLLAGAVTGSSRVDVVEDMTLAGNDCIIETDGGIFDCGLGTQLSELKQRLMLLAWSRGE